MSSGTEFQMKEDYDWHGFNLIRSLVDEQLISKVGFVKHGMAEVMQLPGCLPFHHELCQRI
jgi:hypothetical protein